MLMKMLIDRTVPRYEEISGKEFYFIVTAADNSKKSMERTLEGFRGFTYCLNDASEKGIVYDLGAWRKGDILGNKAMKQAYEMVKNV